MPHLTLEYTKNLNGFNAGALLLELNQALLASGQFSEADIKSRAMGYEQYAIGVSGGTSAFAHISVSILAWRSPEIRRALSQGLLEVLKRGVAPGQAVQASVAIVEMERDAYSKETFTPSQRLSDQ